MQIYQKIKRFSFLIGIGLTLLSLFFIYTGDSAIRRAERISFSAPPGDQLIGFHYRPEEARNYGVLMLEGFGNDQVSMRTAANEFVRERIQVFTFDFAGQGRSEGALRLDNAVTSLQSMQVQSALEVFQAQSGLALDHIFLFGHSAGARAAVQAVVENDLDVAGLILLGPNIQVDDVEVDWIAGLDGDTPQEPVLMLSGSLEDVLLRSEAEALMAQLTGEDAIEAGVEYGSEDATREWHLLAGVLHIFEPISPKALNLSVDWVGEQMDVELNHTRLLNPSAKKIIFWFSTLVGILMFLSGAQTMAESKAAETKMPTLTVVNVKTFLWAKVWLWLPALFIGGILLLPLLFLSNRLPLFNIYFFALIGGYGVLSLVLYLLRKMPGVEGKLVIEKEALLPETINWRYVLGINLLIFVFLMAAARMGWFWVPPMGIRFVWVLVFTPFTALGLWSFAFDRQLLSKNREKGGRLVRMNAFLPFGLYVVLMLLIGSWSGAVYGIFGLLVLWVIYQQGRITEYFTGSRWLAALFQAFLLYLLILPQGALFTL